MEQIYTLKFYKDDQGNVPLKKWLHSLGTKTRTRIMNRLVRVENGNFGDCEPVAENIFELRYHFGAGYRVYFARAGKTLVLLLYGGDKSTQRKDIKKALSYFKQYKGY